MPTPYLVLAETEVFFLPHLLAQLAAAGRISQLVIWRPPTARGNFRRHLSAFGLPTCLAIAAALLIARILDVVLPNRYYSLYSVARRFRLPLLVIDDLADPAFLDLLHPDTLVFTQVSRRLPATLLQRARFINKHAGLLPAYKGVYPVFWALLHDAPQLGVSLHFIDAHFDTGPIVARTAFRKSSRVSFFAWYHRLYDASAALLLAYDGNPATPLTANAPGNYFSFPRTADRRQFLRHHCFGWPLRLHPPVAHH